MSASMASIVGEHLGQQEGVLVSEVTGECLLQLADLVAQPVLDQRCQPSGVALVSK
jgi:hypothetical protein